MNKLVSIISPCYNGEKYLNQFMNSVLTQSYPHIELILVDDASADQTESIVKSYIPLFEKRGYSLVYKKQSENKGQAAAINVGLKIFRGDFVAWMDSDDIYYQAAIEKRVLFLEQHPEYDFVLAQGEIVNEDDLDNRKGILKRIKPDAEDNLFKDLLDENNVVFVPGTILVRSESLRKAIPGLTIYESREGQNWQLMLPLAYCCKYGYIDEVQFKYVLHNDSHSHRNRSYQELIRRRENFYVLQKTTIENISAMSLEEKEYWLKYAYVNKLNIEYRFSIQFFRYFDYLKFRNILKGQQVDTNTLDSFGRANIYRVIRKVKRFVKNIFNLSGTNGSGDI